MSRRLDPLIVGVLAAAVSLAGAARPSFWYDEAATISASYSRSLDQLWQMLGNVDAVHGLYYLFMHGWFQIFPPTEFWSRAPSGLAAGGAAAGIVVLGKQFSSRTVALSAGVLCGILPRTTWAGIEARPYAMSMMAAVWLTVLLVVAARRESRWRWLSYGIVLALSILLDMYLALVLLAHVVFMCIFRRTRTALIPFAVTSGLTVCALAPFMIEVVGQVQQIKWIAPIGRRTIEDVLVQQYFERSPPFAVLSALVAGGGYGRVALDIRKTVRDGSAVADLGGGMAGDTDRPDRDLVGRWSTPSTRRGICPSPRRRWHWSSASASAPWPSNHGWQRLWSACSR